MSKLTDKVVIVTGASGGIGRALCRRLGEAGCRLGLLGRSVEKLETLARELDGLGVRSRAKPVDVTHRADVTEAIRSLQDELGPADIVIHNAGVLLMTDPLAPDLDELERMLRVNYLGAVYALEAVLPTMLARGQGQFVAISSLGAWRGLAWGAGYSASKSAVAAYLESLRPALRRRGIRACTIFPGFVRTPMSDSLPIPLPMLEPDAAARRIVRAVASGRRESAFPWWDVLSFGILRRLPDWLFDRLMARAGEAIAQKRRAS